MNRRINKQIREHSWEGEAAAKVAEWFLDELIGSWRFEEITGTVITSYEYRSYNIDGNLLIKNKI